LIRWSISVEVTLRRQRWSRTLAALFFTTCLASSARAEVPASSRTLARSLFEDARALMADGKYAEACPKLAESMRLDPAAGTQLNLAVCHEHEGRTATAWAEYNDALTQARRDGRFEREQFASEHLKDLSSKLSWLTVSLAPQVEIAGLEVVWDGAVVNRAALGAPSPVDPGVHTIGARAPGFVAWTEDVKVDEAGGRKTVLIPRLVPLPPPVRSGAADETGAAAEGAAEASGRRQEVQRSWGILVGGVGVSGLVVGTLFGVHAINEWNERNTADGLTARESAQSAAWVSDVAFGAGIVGLAAATYLLVTSGHRARGRAAVYVSAAPMVFGAGAAVGVTGGFQ
jgi:hypothetical protein